MKLIYGLGLALTLAPLAAQAPSGPASSFGTAGMEHGGPGRQTSSLAVPLRSSCPVGLTAKHAVDFGMLKVGRGHTRDGAGSHQESGQRLHLTLTSPDGRTMVRATFNVRGWTATSQGHMQQASRNHDAGQAVRTLQAPLTTGADRTASTDLWAPGLTAVTSVELLAVTYADGSEWSPEAGKSCRVQPDPFMLVTQ